jgi:tetratricopeptide (TPR) repeat protein
MFDAHRRRLDGSRRWDVGCRLEKEALEPMNLESQVESYFGSLAGSPDDLDVLSRLERVYGASGGWAALVDAYEAHAAQAEGARAVRLWMEAARLSAVRLQDMERSAQALQHAMSAQPTGALGSELDILVLALQQEWGELEAVFAQSVEALSTPAEQAQLYSALGHILLDVVGDAAQADEMLQFAVQLHPGGKRAQWARQQIARDTEQWDRLRALLVAELEQTPDAAGQVDVLVELGELFAGLGQVEQAGEVLARAFELAPGDVRVRAGLTRLGCDLEALDVEAPQEEASESVPMTEEIALEEIAEAPPVEAAAPSEQPVAATAEGSEPMTIEVENEEDAPVRAVAQESEAAPVEEAAEGGAVESAASRIAKLIEAGEFARAAVSAWLEGDEALALRVWLASARAGKAESVWSAVSWHYEDVGFWRGVVSALREGGDLKLAARAAFAKARDFGAAAELAEAGGDAQIKVMLGEVEAAQADWRKYQRVAEGNYPADMDKDARNEAIFQHMALMAEALGEQDKVFDALRRLERTSRDASVKGRMQRTLRDTEKWPAYVDLLKQEADAWPAAWVEEKIGMLQRAVEVYRSKMHNDLQAIATYKEILKIDERHMPTIDALIVLYEANNRATEQIAMLQQKAELTAGKADKVALLAGIAQLYLDKFRNQAEAIKAYEAVLAIDAYHPAALEFLKDAYDKRREWDKLIEVHRRELSQVSDVRARAEGLKAVAQIAAEKARKNDVAVELLGEALALVPTDLEALGSLEAIHEKAREYEPLSRVLEQRVALLSDRAEQMKIYQKLGGLYSAQLSDADRAIRAWEGALALDSDDLKVRKSLERLYLDNQRWEALEALYAQKGAYADLVRLLEGQVAGNLPDGVKIALLLQAGRVWHMQLGDAGRAEKALERVLQQFDAKNEEAAALLEPLYEASGDVQKLHHVCEILLEHKVEREDRRHYQRKLASLHTQMGDAAGALEWYGRSFAEEPTRLDDAADMERAAGQCGGWAKVVSLYEAALKGADDVGFAHALRMRLGRVLAHEQGRWDEALGQFKRILSERADHVDAMAAMERIYTHLERWDDLLAVYKRRLELVEDAASRVQILGGMARVAEEQAGEPDKAIALLNEALLLLPEDEATLGELHRLYAQQGKWAELVEVIRREIAIVEASGQPSLQGKGTGEAGDDGAVVLSDEAIGRLVALRYELGMVSKGQLGAHDEALEALAFVVGRVPDHDGAREALEDYLGAESLALRGRAADILEPVYAQASAWHPLIVTLRIKVERAADAAEAVALWERIARLYLEQTGELEESFKAYGAIVRLMPEHEEARGRLNQIADTLDQWAPYVALYEEVLPKVGPTQQALRVAYLFDLADAYAERLDEAQRARECYLGVLDLEPDSERALASLEALYMRTEQWRDLLDVYERRLQLAGEDAERVEALQLQMATVWEEMLGDRQEAITLYRKVLAGRPDHLDAVRALSRLYRAESMWQELADNLQLELDLVGVDAGADVQQQLGEVYELHLGRADDAVDLYEEVIKRDAGHAATLASLERVMESAAGPRARASLLLEPLYMNQGAADRLVRALEVQAETSEEPEARVALLHRIAQLWDEFLSDASAAFGVMSRALHEDVSNEHTLAELYRLAEATGAWEALVEVFEAEAEAQYDQDVKRTLLRRAAQVHLESRGEVEACAAVLRRVLELVPDDLETVQDLENIYRHTQEWEALVGVLLKKSELVSEESERLELLHQAGTIREEFLSDPESAIEVYRAALLVNPVDVQALDRLQELYTHLKQWESLLGIYDTKLDLAQDTESKKDLLYVIGAIYQQELEQPDEAIAVYQRILELDEQELGALEKLDVLYERTERWHDLLEVLERQHALVQVPEDQHNLKYRVGKLWETHLSDALQAVQVYEEVLRQAPHHEATRVALEGMVERGEQEVEAARVLQPIYEALEAWEKLIHIYRLLLQTAGDDERRLELYAEIANIYEGCLEERGQAFATWAEALGVDPGRDRTLEMMERLARELGAWDPFIDQLDGRIEESADPDIKVKLQLIVARVYEEEIRDGGAAIDRYQRVLEINSSDEVAIPALDRLYQGEGRWRDLAEILKLRAQQTLDPGERLVFQLRLGMLYQTALEDVNAALEVYRAILMDDPENEHAIEALEQMFASGQAQSEIMGLLEQHYLNRGDYDKVVALYTQRLEYVSEASERFGLWRQIGQVQVQYLQDANQGIIALGKALAQQPDEEAVGELLSLAESSGGWPTAANALMEVLETPGRPDASSLWLTLAQVLDERLGMPQEAEGPYRSALQLDPGSEAALVALDRILLEQARWEELAEVLSQRVAVATSGDDKIELHFRLARVLQQQLGLMDEAIGQYNAVLALDPAHLESLQSLEQIYLGQQRWRELYQTLEARVNLSLDPDEQASLLGQMANIAENMLDERDGAVELWRRVVELRPDDGDALDQLARLYHVGERWSDLVGVLERRIELSADPDEQLALYENLGVIWGERIGDEVQAMEAWRNALTIDPTSLGALEALRDLHARRGEYFELGEVLKRLLDHGAVDSDRKLDLWVELADIQGNMLMQPEDAIVSWRNVMALDPGSSLALENLERFYTQEGHWEEAVQVLEIKADRMESEAERLVVLRQIAQICEGQLYDRPRAGQYLAQVLSIDPTDEAAYTTLEAIYLEQGSDEAHGALVELYLTHAEVVGQDAIARMDTLMRAAKVFEERLGQPESALVVMLSALTVETASQEALLDELERLGRQTGMWAEVMERYNAVLGELTEPGDAFELSRRSGIVMAQDLGQLDDAVYYFQRALQLDPQSVDVLDRLRGIYEELTSWPEMAQVLEARIALTQAADEKIELWRRLGQVREQQLMLHEDAIVAYEQILAIEESDADALNALERLFEGLGRWQELVEILEAKARHTYDSDEIVALRLRAADVYQQQLGRTDRAVATYQDILSVDQSHLGSLRSLEAIYLQQANWESALEVMERQLAVVSGEEQLAIFGRMAAIYEDRFQDRDKAIDAYHQILAVDPGNLEAIAQLERLYAELGRWFDLISTLEAHVQLLPDKASQVQLLGYMAEVHRDRLGDLNAAIDVFVRSLYVEFAQPETWRALASLYEETQNWESAVESYRNLAGLLDSPAEKIAVFDHIGGLIETQIMDPQRAEGAYFEALRLDPGHRPTLEAVRGLYERTGNWQGVIQILKQIEDTTRDLAEKGRALAAVGHVYQERLFDLVSAVRYYEQALEYEPSLVEAAEPLIDVYMSERRWERALPLLERVLERYHADGRRSVEQLHARHLQMAQTCEMLNLHDQARDNYYQAYEYDQTHKETMLGLGRQLNRHGDYEQALQLFQILQMQHLSELSTEEATEIFYQSGLIKQRMGDKLRAIDFFEQALAYNPQHKESLSALLESYEQTGRWDRVVEATRYLLQTEQDPKIQLAYLTRIGDIYAGQLGQEGPAIQAYLEALGLEPRSMALLHKLLNLYTKTRQWLEAVDILKALIDVDTDDARRAKFSYTIGVVFRDEIKDPLEAVRYFEQCLDLDVRQLKAFEAVDRILTDEKDWKALERAYRQMLHRISKVDDEQLKSANLLLWQSLGEIYRSRLGLMKSAIQAYEMVASMRPDDEQTHLILAQLYEKENDAAGMIRQHRELISHNPFRIESFRALFKAYIASKEYDKAWCMASALSFLNSATETEEKFYQQYLGSTLKAAKITFNPELLGMVLHPDQSRLISAIMQQLTLAFGALYASDPRDIGVNKKKDLLDPNDRSLQFCKIYSYVAARLSTVGMAVPPLLYRRLDQAIGLRNANTAPAAFLVGGDMLQGRDERELAFIISKQLFFMLPQHYLGSCGYPTDWLKAFFMVAMHMTNPALGLDKTLGELGPQLMQEFADADRRTPGLIVQTQKLVQQFLATGKNPNLSEWLTAVDHSSSRFGLVLCGDLAKAASCVKNDTNPIGKASVKDKIRDMVVFSISEEYFELRKQLGLAIGA